MIKLIVSDIDGTLLPDGGHTLNPELIDTILKLRAKGMQFAVASGRQWASIEKAFEPIKEKIFYLSDNGACISCCGRNLYAYTIRRELMFEVVRDARAMGLEIMLGGPDVAYLDSKDEVLYRLLIEGYRYRLERVDDLLKVEDDFIKASIFHPTDAEKATVELRERYTDRLKIVVSGSQWIDFSAPGVSKGEAVRHLQEDLNISPRETIAFGDQLNDIEMLGRAYYSFAVANARPEVRKAARFQTDSNVNDGVLKILKGLL